MKEIEQKVASLVETLQLPVATNDPSLRLSRRLADASTLQQLAAARHPAPERLFKKSGLQLRRSSAGAGAGAGAGGDGDVLNESTAAADLSTTSMGGGGGDADEAETSMAIESDGLYGDDLYGGLGGDDDGVGDDDDGEAGGAADGLSDLDSAAQAAASAAEASSTTEGRLAGAAGAGAGGGRAQVFVEPPTPYEVQEPSFARLHLGMRAQQGKRATEKLLQKAKQLVMSS